MDSYEIVCHRFLSFGWVCCLGLFGHLIANWIWFFSLWSTFQIKHSHTRQYWHHTHIEHSTIQEARHWPRTIVCYLQTTVRNLQTTLWWFLVRSYVLELSARRTKPYEEVGGLECGADHQGHVSRAARTWHRGLQKPSLEQEVLRVLVGISDTMDFVV